MAGTKEGVELPDIGVLRQLCRAELASRLDSVSIIIYYIFGDDCSVLYVLFGVWIVCLCHAHQLLVGSVETLGLFSVAYQNLTGRVW